MPEPDRPVHDRIVNTPWPALNEWANNLPTPDPEAMAALTARVQVADTAQFARWGINSPRLIADVSRLFNTPAVAA